MRPPGFPLRIRVFTLLVITHFGGGGFLKLRTARGCSYLVFLFHVEVGRLLLSSWHCGKKSGVVKGGVAVHHHRVLREALSRLVVCRPGNMRGNITRFKDLGGLDGSRDTFDKGRQYIRIGYLVERKHA